MVTYRQNQDVITNFSFFRNHEETMCL